MCADGLAPVITCIGDISTIATGALGTLVDMSDLATAVDNLNSSVPTVTCSDASGSVVTTSSLFPLGLTVVTCIAEDASLNRSDPCAFTVTVAGALTLREHAIVFS